ncbi:MAG: hypothetical protein AAF449_10990 [Myxococcota bacterium]
MKPTNAGYAAIGALMVVTALSVVAVVGFSARNRDLSFEARGMQRYQARRAAESGWARARTRRAEGRSPVVEGTLPGHHACDHISYRTEAGHGDVIVAKGVCQRGPTRIETTLEITVRGPRRGTIERWLER